MRVVLVMKNRQAQLQAQCQHTRRETKQQRGDNDHIVVCDIVLQGDIKHCRGKGDAGIQFLLENQRDTFAEHIAQHPAKHARDHRRNGGDNRAFTHIESNLCANDGKNNQPKRIQHQEQAAQMRHHRGYNRG